MSDLKTILSSQEATPVSMIEEPTLFDRLVDVINPKFNAYSKLDRFDPCTLHGYNLGFPYALVADRFWTSMSRVAFPLKLCR